MMLHSAALAEGALHPKYGVVHLSVISTNMDLEGARGRGLISTIIAHVDEVRFLLFQERGDESAIMAEAL